MNQDTIAAALQRVDAALRRRPAAGRHEDGPALARWEGGLACRLQHDSGLDLRSDMPPEIGGEGRGPTPGWLLRAGLASCSATRIAMAAAAEGLRLDRLEVQAFSCSDLRGLLGLNDEEGHPVYAGPDSVRLVVHIAAAGVPEARLRALVAGCADCAPVTAALSAAVPVSLQVEVLAA